MSKHTVVSKVNSSNIASHSGWRTVDTVQNRRSIPAVLWHAWRIGFSSRWWCQTRSVLHTKRRIICVSWIRVEVTVRIICICTVPSFTQAQLLSLTAVLILPTHERLGSSELICVSAKSLRLLIVLSRACGMFHRNGSAKTESSGRCTVDSRLFWQNLRQWICPTAYQQ